MINSPNNPDFMCAESIHQFSVKNLKGEYVKLDKYKGHICMITNVATKSTLAKAQFKQLNDVIERFGESQGLRILAFPCNQFGNEEPGTSEEIAAFASENNFMFDIFEKIDVNGETCDELWKFLKHKKPDDGRGGKNMIKSNFTKFVINKDGVPVVRCGPEMQASDLVKTLEKCWLPEQEII